MAKPKGPQVEVPEELERALSNTPVDGSDEASDSALDAADAEAKEPPSPEAQLEEMRDRHLRLAAEFENFKRRALRDRQNLQNYGTENLIKELLPTVDNFERALEHVRQAEKGSEVDKVLEGIELTYRSLMQALEKFGVKAVEAEDAAFDPRVHEAIRQVPTSEIPAGTVVEVLQSGYLLKDRLIRPALVAVSKAAEDESV